MYAEMSLAVCSKIHRETAVKINEMYTVKRRLGKETYGAWGGGLQTKR